MKSCPSCAELVQDEAKVCRFCQYDFGRRRNPQFTQGDAAGCALTGCFLWIFGPFILLMIIIFIGMALGSSSPKPADPTPLQSATNAMPAVQPGTVNQEALDQLFPTAKSKHRHH